MKKKPAPTTRICIEKRKLRGGRFAYRLEWFDKRGKRQRRGCGSDLKLAKHLKAKIQEDLRRGVMGDLPDIPLADFIAKLDALMKGKACDTIRKTKKTLNEFNAVCDPGFVRAIDRSMVMEFRAHLLGKHLTPTANRMLRELRSSLTYATDAGYLQRNPLKEWRALLNKEPEKVIRVVERDDYQKLLENTQTFEFRALIITGYRQGLRRTELSNLRWHGPNGEPLIDFDNEVVHVINRPDEGELTKSRKNRSVPMHPETKTALQELWNRAPKVLDGRQSFKHPHVFCWPDGKKFKPNWISIEFGRVVDRAKVSKCTIHDLRRSFSTLAQRAGVDKYCVKDLGGWSDVSVVERHYTGEIASVMRDAMEKIVAAG